MENKNIKGEDIRELFADLGNALKSDVFSIIICNTEGGNIRTKHFSKNISPLFLMLLFYNTYMKKFNEDLIKDLGRLLGSDKKDIDEVFDKELKRLKGENEKD